MITESQVRMFISLVVAAAIVSLIIIFMPRSKSEQFNYLRDNGKAVTSKGVFVYYPKKDYLNKRDLEALGSITSDSTKTYVVYEK